MVRPVPAKVQVSLSAAGSVLGATIYQSAGNPFLDKAAVKAAQQSTFSAGAQELPGYRRQLYLSRGVQRSVTASR